MIKYYFEIARKTIHLSSLWIPILYLYVSQARMLKMLLPLTILALAIDFSRKYFPKINELINKFLGEIMRSEEKESFALSGASYLLMGSSLTIALFNQEIAILALTILMISDSCAALIGRKFGRIHFIGKSLEGSLSFGMSAIFIYYYFISFHHFNIPLKQALLAIFAATLTELFAKKIHLDDNLAIPLTIGLCLAY